MFDVAQQYKVTSVGVNPAKDRAYRMRVYFATMTLRMACIISLIWVRGPWIILVAVGAIVLPYVAVLVANAVSHVGGEAHETPSPLELTSGETNANSTPESLVRDASDVAESDVPAASALIIVDAPAERRASGSADAAREAGQPGDTGDAA